MQSHKVYHGESVPTLTFLAGRHRKEIPPKEKMLRYVFCDRKIIRVPITSRSKTSC